MCLRASAWVGWCALLLTASAGASPGERLRSDVREGGHRVAQTARHVRARVAYHAHATAAAVRREARRVRARVVGRGAT